MIQDEFVGKQFGGYEIRERVGKGGMATVYLARQTSMNRIVAIKLLPRDMMKDDSYLQRFEREVDIVAKLEHRNIVPVYDHGSYDGQPYIVMRYMNAGSIDDVLQNGPLMPDKYLDIVAQIAPALDYAHVKGVLHRDLKPSNVLMDDDGGAYITDFGIARMLGEAAQGSTITTQGVVGTPSYMSPEQAQGLPLDGRSDIYALGVMLFEMATGRRPFHSDTPYSIAVMQVTTPPPSPRAFNPKISVPIEQVILKALKKKPEDRYAYATELAEALRLAIERPVDFTAHDTERPVRKATMADTQPNQPQPQVIQHHQPQQQVYQPQQQPVQSLYPPPTPAVIMPVRQSTGLRSQIKKRRTGGGMWVSVLIGALIGCSLLAAVVTGIALLANEFINGANTSATEPVDGESIISTAEPTGDRSDRRRTATPQGESLAIMPPTIAAALPGKYSDSKGRLIFFAQREGDTDYEIYRLNLEGSDNIQLTSDNSLNMYPAPAPNAQRVAFQSNQDGDFDIFTTNNAGGAIQRLTSNQIDDLYPSWSPDSAWIVFAADLRGDGAYDLMVMRSDGSDLRVILSNGQRNSTPRWSPDGRSILFTTGDPTDASTWDIALLDLTRGNVRYLTKNAVRDAWAVFAPDGSHILYVTGADGVTGLATLAISGLEEPNYIYAGGAGEYIWSPQYSPDGVYILFNAGAIESGVGSTYIMNSDGTHSRRLNTEGGIAAAWIP